MKFQKYSYSHQFNFYFTLSANQLFFSFKEFRIVFRYFSTFHFENEQTIDVVRSMTPQAIRNYNYLINIM